MTRYAGVGLCDVRLSAAHLTLMDSNRTLLAAGSNVECPAAYDARTQAQSLRPKRPAAGSGEPILP